MKFNFSPSKEFSKKAKEHYLAVFDAHYPAAASASVPWPVLAAKAFTGVLAVGAMVLGGASVYADTTNVPADHPLYGLKRLNEEVRFAIAPTGQKAQLQAAFAARRVSEIGDLSVRTPSSAAITALANDADDAVNASIMVADRTGVGDGELTALCDRLFSAIATSSFDIQNEIAGHGKLLAKFTEKCEKSIAQDTRPGGPAAAASLRASETVSAPAPVVAAPMRVSESEDTGESEATSVSAEEAGPGLEVRIQNFLNRNDQEGRSIRIRDNDEGGD